MFGHGVPGMTCGMRVEAFDNLALTNKVILCGSCFSAAPAQSDFPKMAVGPDGSEVVANRKRFLMEAVEHGAVVAYGHMRLNAGFPHLYPVLDSLLHGETVGEAYQRLIDGLLEWTQLDARRARARQSRPRQHAGPDAAQPTALRHHRRPGAAPWRRSTTTRRIGRINRPEPEDRTDGLELRNRPPITSRSRCNMISSPRLGVQHRGGQHGRLCTGSRTDDEAAV